MTLMLEPRRVCVVVTARPSYSRIKSAMRAIDQHPQLQLQLIVAASALLDRYGAVVEEIEKDGFEPDAEVYMVLEGESPLSMAKTTGLGVLELATALNHLKPDVVVTVADRFETMATAIAASYMNTPLVHIQGGEVTGSIDEKVRHAITKLADLHLVSNHAARDRVVRMGELPEKVINTGCPSIDLVAELGPKPILNFDPMVDYPSVGGLTRLDDRYLVVMQHPVTTEFERARRDVEETLHAIADLNMPTLWFWPNVDAGADGTSKGIRAWREYHDDSHLRFYKNMSPSDFLRLIANASCLVGNSSAGIRESAYLGVPVVDIGSRQKGRERATNVVWADHTRGDIAKRVNEQVAHGPYPSDHLYGDGHAGKRIAEEISVMQLTIEKKLAY